MGLIVSDKFRKAEIAGFLGRPIRTITSWVDRGIVIPDVEPSQGKGIERIYSYRNVIEFGMIELMSKMDITLKEIGIILETLRKGKWKYIIQPEFEDDEGEEGKGVEFYDFFTSDEWGRSIELAFCKTVFLYHKDERIRLVTIGEFIKITEKVKIQERGEAFEIFHTNVAWKPDDIPRRGGLLRMCTTEVIWLGGIKISAAELIPG
jgi:hypothetical protein